MAASWLTVVTGELKSSARDYQVQKWFYDYADNIEAVNIHYACTPLGQVPDWNRQRTTRFLPLVGNRMRRKLLKLPARILDDEAAARTSARSDFFYTTISEIFADGGMYTHYSRDCTLKKW